MSVGEATAGTVTSNATLAKLYLPDVAKIIESPAVVNYADDTYDGEGGISASSINVDYGENSMIFTVSYSDLSSEAAAEKLITLITCASEALSSGAVEAKDVSLISTQNEIDISVNEGFMKYVLLGTAAGIVLSILLAILIYALDTTIVDREEFEEITDVPVLSYIAKVK
jgi:capsular polysaccharide biosynthesis protein